MAQTRFKMNLEPTLLKTKARRTILEPAALHEESYPSHLSPRPEPDKDKSSADEGKPAGKAGAGFDLGWLRLPSCFSGGGGGLGSAGWAAEPEREPLKCELLRT